MSRVLHWIDESLCIACTGVPVGDCPSYLGIDHTEDSVTCAGDVALWSTTWVTCPACLERCKAYLAAQEVIALVQQQQQEFRWPHPLAKP